MPHDCGCRLEPEKKNRADRIRTCDLFVPNEARYQPALQLAVLESRGNYTWKISFGKYKIVPYGKNVVCKWVNGGKIAF